MLPLCEPGPITYPSNVQCAASEQATWGRVTPTYRGRVARCQDAPPSSVTSTTPVAASSSPSGAPGRGRGMPNATQCATVGQLRPCIDVPAGNDETVKCRPPSTVETSLTRSAGSGPHGPVVEVSSSPLHVVADVQLRSMIWSASARSGVTVHEWPPLVVER